MYEIHHLGSNFGSVFHTAAREHKKMYFCVIIIILTAAHTQAEDEPVVQTAVGQLRGKVVTVFTDGIGNRSLTTFFGIPYARPPINAFRFQAPKNYSSWTGIRDAYDYGAICHQVPLPIDGYATKDMNEDCLTLNIRIPGYIQNITNPLPVMVWIHPGGLQSEASKSYDGSQLALHGNVIFVTINYRLGLFGYLSVNNTTTTTNNGLRDMIMSLEWIKENIASFGGDPNKVTIFGHSGGGIGVTLLLASPKAKGLFQRAISQSGSFNTMRLRPTKDIFESTLQVAEAVNCPARYSDQVVNCLQKLDAQSLMDTQPSDIILLWKNRFNLTFVPVYGDDILPEKPIDLFKSGKTHDVDLIIGGTNDDGSWTLPFTFRTIPVDQEQFEYELARVTEALYQPEWIKAQETAVYFYTPLSKEKHQRKLLDAQTERMFGGIRDVADYQSIHHSNSSVYFYVFNYTPATRIFSREPDWMIGVHGEDLVFTFGQFLGPVHMINFTLEEQELTRQVLSAYTNFAKYGNPNPLDSSGTVTWPKYSRQNREYLELKVNMTNASNVKSQYRERELDFWTVLMPHLASSERGNDGGKEECGHSSSNSPKLVLAPGVLMILPFVMVIKV